MYSLWTAVAPTMFQRLKLLKDFLSLFLNRRQAKELLEQVQASNLSDDDRERVSQILRLMLRLPEESLQKPSCACPPLTGSPHPTGPSQGSGSIGQRLMPWSAGRMVIGWA